MVMLLLVYLKHDILFESVRTIDFNVSIASSTVNYLIIIFQHFVIHALNVIAVLLDFWLPIADTRILLRKSKAHLKVPIVLVLNRSQSLQ